jgi:hypothetical protein
MWVSLCMFLLCVSLPAQTAKSPDPWERLSFLIGEWEGVGSGGVVGEGIGGATFTYDLDKNIIVRKNWAKYPPRPGEKTGISHEDLMIIYPSPGEPPFRAIYFDNEGHVINYLVSFPGKIGAVNFETDPSQKGLRFRLEYEINPDKSMRVDFLMAPPGGDLKLYAHGTMKKK